MSAISLADDQNLQFARRLDVPAHATVTSWQPILVPANLPRGDDQDGIQELRFRALLFETSSSGSQLLEDEMGRMQLQGTAWLARPGPVTGVVTPPTRTNSADYFHPIAPDVLVATSRVEKGVSRNLVVFDQGFLPGGEESLDGYDQLVIADERPLSTPTSIEALRRWLYGGGQLWVMLDQVSPSLLAALLGNDFSGQVVDRVSLTNYHIQSGPDRPPVDEKPQSRDQPVEFIRMLIEDVDVAFTIDGWPAAYTQNCGSGRLYVTTFGLDGWVRPRQERDDPPPAGPVWQTGYVPGDALEELTLSFFSPRTPPPVSPSVLEEQSREAIGYSIPSRGLVIGILGSFAIALVAVGAWLLKIGEAQRLALFGPVLTVVVSMALMGVGRSHRAIPSVTAVSQFVQPIQGTTDVRSTGAVAMFVSETGNLRLAGEEGGWVMPESVQEGVMTRRMVWSGLKQWEWENLEQPAGLQSASLYAAAEMETNTQARTSFDSSGVIGSIELPNGLTASDPVIVTRTGRMATEVDDSGRFTALGSRVLTGNNFFSDGLLSDQQTNRSEVLTSLFASSDNPYMPDQPTIFFWTAPWELGMSYPTNTSLTGAALVTLPLSLERPTAESILIPSPFLPYQEVTGLNGEMPSGVYDYRKHRWQPRSSPSAAMLRFQIPKELGPLQPSVARMTVRAIGPMGLLQISGIHDGTLVPIDSRTDPAGEIRFQWDDPDLLQLDEAGGILVHIAMGDPGRPELTRAATGGGVNYFQIETLSLELQATTNFITD